jgi:hypothetical protein
LARLAYFLSKNVKSDLAKQLDGTEWQNKNLSMT